MQSTSALALLAINRDIILALSLTTCFANFKIDMHVVSFYYFFIIQKMLLSFIYVQCVFSVVCLYVNYDEHPTQPDDMVPLSCNT